MHSPRRRASAIGLFAIADADEFDGVAAAFAEDDTPVADAEAIARRIEAVKLLDSPESVSKNLGRLLSKCRAVARSMARTSAQPCKACGSPVGVLAILDTVDTDGISIGP
ncbi:MAG: hypothetical protein ABSB35_22880 [Bryobacteraceae bacterium]|jgi:hypothetical protein